ARKRCHPFPVWKDHIPFHPLPSGSAMVRYGCISDLRGFHPSSWPPWVRIHVLAGPQYFFLLVCLNATRPAVPPPGGRFGPMQKTLSRGQLEKRQGKGISSSFNYKNYSAPNSLIASHAIIPEPISKA